MNAEKLMSPSVQIALVEAIKSSMSGEGVSIFFHTQQNKDGLVDYILAEVATSLESIFEVLPQVKSGEVILCCHPRGMLLPTEQEEEFAHFLENQGIGFYLLHPSCTRVKRLAKATTPQFSISALNLQTIADPLKPGGGLSQIAPNYEPREAQIALLEFIAHHFNENSIGIAEGGTGVGKSFAYLIPAIQWAQANDDRIVISTATIALQQQLLHKDIPFVKRLLKSRIKAVLVKGKQNYLCLHHLFELLEEEKMFLKEQDPLLQIALWAETTKTGDKSDLPFLPPEDTWSRISGDTETCLGTKCAHYQNCFIFKARKDAMQAQIIVVNHHLFFADLVLRNQMEHASLAILPAFRKVIFDEAHQLEASATHFFSSSFSHYAIQRQISRLLRWRSGTELGLLAQLAAELPSSEYYHLCLEKAHEGVEQLRRANDLLQAKHSLLSESALRLHKSSSSTLKSAFLLPFEDLFHALSFLKKSLEDLRTITEDSCQDSQLTVELRLVQRRVNVLGEICHNFLHYEEYPDLVFWAEQRKNRQQDTYYTYISTPLDIAAMLDQYLYKQGHGVIMVSATLTFSKKFDFFLKKTGLLDLPASSSCQIFSSPFNYQKQTLFLVPTDIPPVDQEVAFSQYAYRLLQDLLITNKKGSMLVLFTSYKALRDCAEVLQPFLAKKNIQLLKQGDADRQKLIAEFVGSERAVLLGTDSFWEGVDIDNKVLKMLVIFRLPFQPPNIPLIQAKQERIEQRGGNPFIELQVPEAAIKLKQGFGRLMRKSADFGIIMLLDNRVIKKFYGELFLGTLPSSPYCTNYEGILQATKEFFTQHSNHSES